MEFFQENLRLKELVAIVNSNEDFFRDFILFLREKGYVDVQEFMQEEDSERALDILSQYLRRQSNVTLYDGLLRPYKYAQARWYFLAWLMRDAPAQRLNPLLSSVPGNNVNERRAYLLNEIRKFVAPLFPKPENWEWAAVAEVMLARLEGSRRALKGTLFEGIIRRNLATLFDSENLPLTVSGKEVRIGGETYDVRVDGQRGTLLIPVKTRETMGGGHAMLFTRDIFKAIDVAKETGYGCIPIVIAESWGGNLDALSSEHYVWVRANPNDLTRIEPELADKLAELVSVFRGIA